MPAIMAMVTSVAPPMHKLCRRHHRRLKDNPGLWAEHALHVGMQEAADGGQLDMARCRHCGSNITRRVQP